MKTVKEINNYVGYKVEIFPTEEQKSIFNRYFGTARYVYNLGIDIDNNFKPDFVVDDGKKDIVKSLKEKVKNAGLVYIATDPDRP